MAVPDLDHARGVLRSFELPEGIVVHSEGVRRVASAAARLVADSGVPLDVALVESAALLHDIDKPETRDHGELHGLVGAERLARLGYGELAPPVASHPVSCLLDDDRFPRGWPSVIVSVADRHVAQQFVSIDERLDDMATRHPEHAASIRAARRPAHALERQLAEVVGLDLAALVACLRDGWEADA
jgi:molybdenum cofactor cytidylyltransferase